MEITRIPLKKIQLIRLSCQRENCGGVAEIPTSRLEALVGEIQCPSCGRPYHINQVGSIGGLKALGMALRNLVNVEHLGTEFVIEVF